MPAAPLALGPSFLNPEWLISTFGADRHLCRRRFGPALFRRPDARLFKQENLTRAQDFFEKYGARSIVLARFVPIVPTFTPIVAGASGMRYRTFLIYNVVGGTLWGCGVTVLGYSSARWCSSRITSS